MNLVVINGRENVIVLFFFFHSLNKNKMLITSHNPTKRVSHTILKDEKHFTVQFTCLITGKTAIEKYAIPLTTKEIEAEYDYISF